MSVKGSSTEAAGGGHRVLLVGGTGRTGSRVLTQLLERRVPVCAIVRSAGRLPAGVAGDPLLTVVEADILSLSDDELRRHLSGCDTAICCLGHTISLRGVFGSPRDLVTQAVGDLCRATEQLGAAAPLRFILMSSVSVNRPDRGDTRRSSAERAYLWALRGMIPPARDNQRAADHLRRHAGQASQTMEWAIVRPDSLLAGDVSDYSVSEGLVNSIFRSGQTTMSNVAHFMCELATDAATWQRWKGSMPVIVNASGA